MSLGPLAALGARASRLEYVDVNLTYGRRGVVLTGGVMKQSTSGWRTGWHLYVGGGVGSDGLSAAITVSPSAVSTGWNAALSSSDGLTAYQAGVDSRGTPFVEGGVGGPRGRAILGFHVWRLPTG